MTDAVDAFRRISGLIVKWLVVGTLGIVVLALAVWGAVYAYYWYTYDRNANAVEFLISTSRKDCTDDAYPIHIIIGNSSHRTLERAEFSLAARVKGRSTDIAKYNDYVDDHISPSKRGYGGCYAAPVLSEPVADLRDLDWSISSKKFKFAD